MASSTTQELELRLAEVEHQLAHLEALERGAGVQAPEGVRAERARRRAALAAERSALRAELAGPSAPPEAHPPSWPGLWEPLPLYPAAPPPERDPTEAGAPPDPSSPAGPPSPASTSPTWPAERRRRLLDRVASLYRRGRRFGSGADSMASVLRAVLEEGQDDPAVQRVAFSAAEDFLNGTWLDAVLTHLGMKRPPRPDPAAPVEPAPRTEATILEAEAPDAEGLTPLQRRALEAALLGLRAGDRPGSLAQLAELRALRSEGAFEVTLVVRPVMSPLPAAELDARLAAAVAGGALDPCTWRLDAGGALTVELGHVAFLSRLVRWLRAQGLAERRERLGYQVREASGMAGTSRRELLGRFVRLELEREAHRQALARAGLVERLRLAQALVVGAFLHPVVDALIVEADTPAEARWALQHLNDEALWSRAPFTRLAGEAPRLLGTLREALEAALPELAGLLRQGLSEAEAEAIRGATQLRARRQELLGDLRRCQAAVAALEALDTPEARVEAVGRRLDALARRHADARRTRVVSLAEVLPGPGFTPRLDPGP